LYEQIILAPLIIPNKAVQNKLEIALTAPYTLWYSLILADDEEALTTETNNATCTVAAIDIDTFRTNDGNPKANNSEYSRILKLILRNARICKLVSFRRSKKIM
jgi:hypothetical protein